MRFSLSKLYKIQLKKAALSFCAPPNKTQSRPPTKNTTSLLLSQDDTKKSQPSTTASQDAPITNKIKAINRELIPPPYTEEEYHKALEQIKTNGLELKNLIEPLKSHKEVILCAIQQNAMALEFVAEKNQTLQVVLTAVSQQGWALYYTAKKFLNNATIIERAIKENHNIYKDLTKQISKLTEELEITKNIMRMNGRLLRHTPKHLKEDQSLVKIAVTQYGLALKYAKNFQANQEMVALAVQQNGLALEFADPLLKANPDIVKTAVQENGMALKFADKTLQAQENIVLSAVKQNGNAIEFCDKSLRTNLEESVHLWSQALTNAPEAKTWLPHKFYTNCRIKAALETSVQKLFHHNQPITIIDNHFSLEKKPSPHSPTPNQLNKNTLAFHTRYFQDNNRCYLDEWAEKLKRKAEPKSDNTVTSSSNKRLST
jgi:hypothetical protein